jgi:hypothetical protein
MARLSSTNRVVCHHAFSTRYMLSRAQTAITAVSGLRGEPAARSGNPGQSQAGQHRVVMANIADRDAATTLTSAAEL